ncbi:FCD domain-containing protein [Microbacterium neungamense]|uniref:FCD domain-containing protein n=1 Tax=Microbacterium neungamense TaxID=2810535 RepID=UPI00217EE2C5|nr:FCD domain-containing protein [Microbacterium neungamense]UWF76936.1 FCD domain-containing protein [Microbacterium neungamense]
MELRVAVEPMAARLAARRATPQQRAELRRLAEEMGELGRRGLAADDAYLQADIAFHELLLTASGNPLLATLRVPVREVLAGRTRLGLHPPVPAPGTLEDHLRLALDIAAGDADAAERQSRSHLLGVLGELAPRPAPPVG